MKAKTLLLLLTICARIYGHSQSGSPFIGTWEGKLNVGIELRLVLHISDAGSGVLATTMDSPDQNAYGMKCDSTFAAKDSITVLAKALKASFMGRLTGDSLLEGVYRQGSSFPLVLRKVLHATVRKPPQAPQPPFPYKSEDVGFDSKDKSLHYGATLTLPPGNGPFPAVLLITGSGPQNRDEEIMGHKLFAVLADGLSRNGIAVLRVDDRGVGKSTGNFAEATSADFANDVNTSLDYLLTRPEVDKKKTGLIGHSEGGMIAPVVASARKDVAFIVLLAGPGVRIYQLMAEQNAAILRSVNISQKAIDAYIPLYTALMKGIVAAPDTATAKAKAMELMSQWRASTDTALLNELGFGSESEIPSLANKFVKGFSGNWFKYFLAFDPAPYLEQLKGKVLALNGEKDLQVIPASNLAGIENALKKSKVKSYTVKTIPGLNHLFQTCVKCTLQEYADLEETFSPVALQIINDWLDKNVK
jgi:uncharacterized protein